MAFSFKDTWACCDGATCPCANHLGPDSDSCLPLVFPDALDSHPTLRSGNDCPTSSDEDIINSSIPILQAQIRETEVASKKLTQLRNILRLDLDKVEGGIDRLREHHGTLLLALDRRSRIKAPIRRLPSEILTEILWITTLLGCPIGGSESVVGHGIAELEVFQLVCQQWRRVVLHSPRLWSHILIYPRGCNFQTVNSREYWSLQRCMVNSACVALDVNISTFGELPLPPLLLTFLGQVCSRIKSLSLSDLSPPELLSLFPLRDTFHSLHYLHFENITDPDSDFTPIKLFDKAPKLAFYDTRDLAECDLLGMPWSQIIRHSHDYTRIQAAVETLEAAHNLQDATFIMAYGSLEPLRIGLDPIECTRLTHLTAELQDDVEQDAHPLRQLFQQCSFPALVQLRVSTAGDRSPYYEPDTSPLSVLSYNSAPLAPADVNAFFRSIRTISHVEFKGVPARGLSDAAFQSLHIQPGQVAICAPVLESIVLEGEMEFDVAEFAAMVKSRWEVTPLSSIDLHWHIDEWPRRDPEAETKTRRWTLEGAILADELDGHADRGMYLGICTKRCKVLYQDH